MLPYGCYLECYEPVSGSRLKKLEGFLSGLGLDFDRGTDFTACIYNDAAEVIATASLQQNILKCIGVSEKYQGEGLTADLMTALLNRCAERGSTKQLLYTKPKNREMFRPFGFEPLAVTDTALLMERPAGGIRSFLASLPRAPEGCRSVGAIVAHCNPITNGHLYLMRRAAAECDFLYIFILSEDRGEIPERDRRALVKEAAADIRNAVVCPTDQYLISSATFPTYFLHDSAAVSQAWTELDVQMFGKWFVPALGITRRFAGTEPFSPVTEAYNRQMEEMLPGYGVEFSEFPRLAENGTAVSATLVRRLAAEGRAEELRALVPECTLAYLLDPERSREAMKRLAAGRK